MGEKLSSTAKLIIPDELVSVRPSLRFFGPHDASTNTATTSAITKVTDTLFFIVVSLNKKIDVMISKWITTYLRFITFYNYIVPRIYFV